MKERTSRQVPRPSLGSELTLLRVPSEQSTALHRLVVDELSTVDGSTLWLDAGNVASTYALYELAPSRRTLADVQVARAFTAYQHHSLVRAATRDAPADLDLVVAPNVTSLYCDDEISDPTAADLLESSLTILSELAATFDAPVVATTAGDAPLVAEYATREIECTETALGFRYESDDFTTDCYRTGAGWQTTIPYWVDLFGAISERNSFPVADQLELAVGV